MPEGLAFRILSLGRATGTVWNSGRQAASPEDSASPWARAGRT